MGVPRKSGWTHSSAAVELGVAPAAITKWLLGDRYPDVRMMHKIHAVLNWPARDQVDLIPAVGYDLRYALVLRDVLNVHFQGEEITWGRGAARRESARVANTLDAISGLPLGTRLATNTNKIMVLEEREDGVRYWIEPGTLEPFVRASYDWLPAYILPV